MKIYKLIELDTAAERKRIAEVKYTKAQRAALIKLLDLIEAGDWGSVLEHYCDKTAFPYNTKEEYNEQEHIGYKISTFVKSLSYDKFYTEEQLIKEK